ncbi:MAG: hypothetical protein FJY09_04895 [Chlorobi bacterium]|nr:hypothetical protein [Chlorobiota bacterium]
MPIGEGFFYFESINSGKRKFFNVMADDVETVSVFLTDRMLAARDRSPEIRWLTKPRMLAKLLCAPFIKRDFFS